MGPVAFAGPPMDFVILCQALGLAISAGLVIGVAFPAVMPPWGALAGAVPIGIVAGVMILSGDSEPIWPAFITGPLGAGLAAVVSHDVATGAARRAGAGTTEVGGSASVGIAAMIVVAALAVAVISIVAPPVSLAVFVGLAWIWLMRRRQAERKHEGLRILR